MAIRDDNTPPRTTPGSITQAADSNIDRIGNISNVSKTVSNMQKDVKQKISETKHAVEEGQQVSMVQKSMTTVLDKLSDTIGALSAGVKTITVDTAQATKDSISQYGKAISEDISFNKQSIVAMALAKSTPIYGYFAAKFMETDVFKKAAERMKASIGKVFGSLAGVFRRGKKGPGEDTAIPKMHSGGYVKKGGLTELHAGEVVAPIEKILKRIDDSISTTKDLAKITEKTALHMTTDLKGYIKSSSSSDKSQMNIFRSFIRTYKEVGERAFTEQPVERMARSLLAIQETMGAQLGNWRQVMDEMLANHPTLVKMKLAWKATSGALTAPYKIARAFFRVKGWGGYRAKLSKAKNPLQATAENIASLYVDLMWRLDNMIPLIKLTAQASRDTASKLTGNTYPRVKGIPKEKRWSVSKVASMALGMLPGTALSLLGSGVEGLGGLLGKKGGKTGAVGKGIKSVGGATGTIGDWIMQGGGEVGKKKRLAEQSIGALPFSSKKGAEGAEGGGAMWVTETNTNAVSVEYQKWIKHQADSIKSDDSIKLLEHRTLDDKYKHMKADRVTSMWQGDAAKKQVSMLGKLRKTLKGNRWIQYLFIIGGFLKTMLMMAWSPIKLGLMTLLGISSTGRLIGGGAGLLGGISNMFGKGGSAGKMFGKGGSMSKMFGKGGRMSKLFGKGGGMSKMFGKGGKVGGAFKSIGPKIAGMLASGPFFAALAAAGVGVAIGTWLNKAFVKPFLDKMDKEFKTRGDRLEKEINKKRKTSIGDVRDTTKSDAKRFQASQLLKMQNIGSKERSKQLQGWGIIGDNYVTEITSGQQTFLEKHINDYLMYDPNQIKALRIDWAKRGGFRTRKMGEHPDIYGQAREKAFLSYIRLNLKQYTDSQYSKQLVARGIKEKPKPPPQPKWSAENEQKRLTEKDQSLMAKLNKFGVGAGVKGNQLKNLVVGTGKNWWSKLDTKSRAALQEAKKYYIKEFGMSEAEADAHLQALATKVSNRVDMMMDPKTYKTFGEGVKAEYKERAPGLMDTKNMVVGEVKMLVAGGDKLAVEIAKEVKGQTKELVDNAVKTGAGVSATIVNGVSTTVNNLSSSNTTAVNSWDPGNRSGRDFVDEMNFDGNMP